MAATAAEVLVTSTAQIQLITGAAGKQVVLKASGSNQVFIGPTGVTQQTGFPLPGGVPFVISGASDLFAIAAVPPSGGAGTVGVRVLLLDA